MDWGSKYEIGDRELDEEHRALVEAISVLENAVSKPASSSEVQVLLGRLANYMRVHFSIEEDRMRAAQYPGIEKHKEQHTEFLKRLNEWHRAPPADDLSREMIAFVSGWVAGHILESDHEMARYFPSRRENGRRSESKE